MQVTHYHYKQFLKLYVTLSADVMYILNKCIIVNVHTATK